MPTTTTILSTHLPDPVSVKHQIARLIRDNPLYQRDGKNDEPWLVEDVRKHFGYIKAETITREARKVRELRTKWQPSS